MRLAVPALPACLATTIMVGLAPRATLAGPTELAQPGADPVGISNGQVAPMCSWPTAVGVTGGNSLCTGTLVHPRIVIYAAHCGGGEKKIVFGQDVGKPYKTINTDLCLASPEYGGVNDQEHDWAFCRLVQDVEDIPVTPVVYGCEEEIVYAGQTVGIAGFGITSENGESGVKNWGLTPIRQVFGMAADVGGLGDPGICPGDSGGPAFVRYPDNSWHVWGIASTLTGECGGLGTHSIAWNAVPWIEEESGYDITPCHDLDGTWNPTHRCTNFYAGEPGQGYGEFGEWCPGTPFNGASATCGQGFDAVPDNSPPTVVITTPVTASYPDMTSFMTAIEVDAQDGDGWGVKVVQIKINGMVQPLDDKYAPFAFPNVKFPKGTFELVAVAEDAAGLVTESEPVVLEIGVVPEPETTGGETTTGAPPTTGETPTTEPDPDTGADPSNPSTQGESSISDTAATSLTTAPMDEADDGGCGCRSQPPTSAALWLLGLLVCVRRRDRQA